MRILSLFSGIGGLDLAAEWAGMRTVAFCEIDAYACKVLKRRWPDVPIYSDVRELTAEKLKEDGIREIDLIIGGFPCQDVSCAGKRVGFYNSDGQVTRSGLWAEYARIIGEVRPKWIVAENVPGLLTIPAMGRNGGGFGIVLRDLADLGYDAGWGCYGAAHVGAEHLRKRVFVVAHTLRARQHNRFGEISAQERDLGNYYFSAYQNVRETFIIERENAPSGGRLPIEPAVCRAVDGLPDWVERVRCLGNAVSPQQAYPIFSAIKDLENSSGRA